jgi:two-component system, response regulator YesN
MAVRLFLDSGESMAKRLSSMPRSWMVHILVADDEAPLRHLIVKVLSAAGWEHIETVQNGADALTRLTQSRFELCILDLRMPTMGGLEVIEKARLQGIETDIVVLTGYGTVENAVQAMKSGAQDFLRKPIRPEELQRTALRLLRKHRPVPHVLAEKLDTFLAHNAARLSLKVGDLCRHFEISPRYVSLLFNNYVGASFPQRRTYHRMQRAKRLIDSTQLPLYDIARKCGFRDYRRLHEAFRQLEDMSPRQYGRSGAGNVGDAPQKSGRAAIASP